MKHIGNQYQIVLARQRILHNVDGDDLYPFCDLRFLDCTRGKDNHPGVFHDRRPQMRESAATRDREAPKTAADIEESFRAA
jgi:hypothetical protein